MTRAPLRIGLAGLGTVGQEVARQILTEGDMLAAQAGRPIQLAAVSARARNKPRAIDLAGLSWVEHPAEVAMRPGVDAVVELMGGAEGAALELARTALSVGAAGVPRLIRRTPGSAALPCS